MKTRLLLWLLAGGSLTCFASDSIRPDETATTTWIDPADSANPALVSIRQAGERMIDRVGHLLIYEVERAVAEKGLGKAVETVHLKDLLIPKPERGQPRITAVRHTSLELRNPANRPDAADRAALEIINTALRDNSEVPAVLVQQLDRPGQPAEWRVYRPITTMPLCLKCHGPVDGLAPEVRAQLALKYPDDRAAGYTAYKWRGVIRVSLAAPEPVGAK